VESPKRDPPRRLETRIKRGFPHPNNDGDGGLTASDKAQPRATRGLLQIPAQNRFS